jgi:RHS repeat-associated protein
LAAAHRARPANALGRDTDFATGWSFHGARWFAPELGQWTAPDPLLRSPAPLLAAEPWRANPYAYLNGAPLDAWDPDGRDGVELDGVGVEWKPRLVTPDPRTPDVRVLEVSASASVTSTGAEAKAGVTLARAEHTLEVAGAPSPGWPPLLSVTPALNMGEMSASVAVKPTEVGASAGVTAIEGELEIAVCGVAVKAQVGIEASVKLTASPEKLEAKVGVVGVSVDATGFVDTVVQKTAQAFKAYASEFGRYRTTQGGH